MTVGLKNALKSGWRVSISIISVALAVVSIAGFIPNVWIADLCNHFRLVYAPLLLICSGVLLLTKAKELSIFCFLVFVINALPIVRLMTPHHCDNGENSPVIKVLNSNIESIHNRNYEQFRALIRERNPDLFAVVEIDKQWSKELQSLEREYPYKRIIIERSCLSLFSRYPFENIAVRRSGENSHPRIVARTNIGSRTVIVTVVHVPVPRSDAYFKERNDELDEIAREIAASTEPNIVMGDFNCTPWSPTFVTFLHESKLHDSEKGFGPIPTWPARANRLFAHLPIPPLFPIDHILLSKGICVLNRQTGPAIGADHLPVSVELALGEPPK